MRICFIADPRSVHTIRWVSWFARRHDVHLVRTAPALSTPEWPGPTLTSERLMPGTRLLLNLRQVRAYVRATQPDIVHGHYINEAGWLAAWSGHDTVVLSAWGSDLYRAPRESKLAAWLNPLSARSAAMVTCDSSHQASVLADWGVEPDRIHVVGWGVDLDAFSPSRDGSEWRRRLDIPFSARVILSPRQWLENSRIHEILDAFELLPTHVHLILKRLPAFEGAYGADVAARIASMECRDRIHMVEEIAEEELPALYAAADCVVSLCETDGTPVSVLEAMASGLPVVAFRNPSLAEWISPEGGALLSDIRGPALAGALRSWLQEGRGGPAGSHNRSVVVDRASRTIQFERMEKLYEKLASKRNRDE